jgi:hypothetical protein
MLFLEEKVMPIVAAIMANLVVMAIIVVFEGKNGGGPYGGLKAS